MEQMEQMALWSAAFQSRRLFSRQRIGGFSVAAASQSLGFSVDGGIGGFSVARLFSRKRIGGFSVAAASQSRRLLSRSASQSTADGSCTVKGAGSAACRLNRRTAAAPRGASGDGGAGGVAAVAGSEAGRVMVAGQLRQRLG